MALASLSSYPLWPPDIFSSILLSEKVVKEKKPFIKRSVQRNRWVRSLPRQTTLPRCSHRTSHRPSAASLPSRAYLTPPTHFQAHNYSWLLPMLAEPVFTTLSLIGQPRKKTGRDQNTAAADAAAATEVHSHEARATPGRAAAGGMVSL